MPEGLAGWLNSHGRPLLRSMFFAVSLWGQADSLQTTILRVMNGPEAGGVQYPVIYFSVHKATYLTSHL